MTTRLIHRMVRKKFRKITHLMNINKAPKATNSLYKEIKLYI